MRYRNLGSCKSKTSAEANNGIHLLKTKAGREWERETARLTEREGRKEGRERERHRESEGEAERVREREDRSSLALQKCTELLKSLTEALRIVVRD